ncbi:hypothetical protein [Microbacterium sp. GCS4]|uniref:hypothetical protein n=1 Tax=Microbacterium sp. GCS4 TaxID=1692239 RepID=UPI000680E20D|nr:hypothetical protein [Microbacterium sp. GCS4]KNY07603.1 hypothetical protein AKH00_04955 [Microbacterium sp. GCS4]
MNVQNGRRGRSLLAVIVTGSMLVLAACAPEPAASPTPEPTPTSSEDATYDGPIAFVGDELDAFALTAEEITGLVPEATDVAEISPVLEQVSDGGGMTAVPEICETFYAEQSLGAVGARTIGWKVPSDPDVGFGRLLVIQFADEVQAQQRMDQLLKAAQQCASFVKETPATYEAVITADSGDVRAFAGTLRDTASSNAWRSFTAYASTGNVLVELWQPFSGERTFDAQAAASLLQSRAQEARDGLIEDLTANPPIPEGGAAPSTGAAWSEWPIGVGGIGPVRLGDPIDAAVSAAGGTASAPEYDGGPWTIVNERQSGTLSLQPVEGGTTLASITAGNSRTFDEPTQTGADLPSRGDVRVGDTAAKAMTAYPGGTTVVVASSGDYYYAVSTREGVLFVFHTDIRADEAGSSIIGITVEDATQRKSLVFG